MKHRRTSDEVDRDFFIKLGALDYENKQETAREAALEKSSGEPLPRCPICGGRRIKNAIGSACAYCGKVESCET